MAIFVAFHVGAVLLLASPAPEGGMSRSAWSTPTVQDEFDGWRGRLAALGWELSREEFEEGLWGFAQTFTAARDAVLTPFEPYGHYCGVTQSWRLFVAPHTHPAELHLDLEEGGSWRPLYRPRSVEFDWYSGQLEQFRTRSIVFRYSWSMFRKSWRALVGWLGERAHEDFPEATRIRGRWWRFTTPSAAETLAGHVVEGTYEGDVTVRIGARR